MAILSDEKVASLTRRLVDTVIDYKKEAERLAMENENLRAALREAADELDAYYRAEYPGDHPYSQRKLAEAIAANPARAALEGEGK